MPYSNKNSKTGIFLVTLFIVGTVPCSSNHSKKSCDGAYDLLSCSLGPGVREMKLDQGSGDSA